MDQAAENKLLVDHFTKYITDHKREFLEKVLDLRTRHITMVLEEIHQSQNASAPDGISIHDVPVEKKIALVMGNELNGTSDYALSQADMKVRIPMYGFTESMNISVSAAICLNTLVPKLHQKEVPWQLSPLEKDDIRLRWLRKMIKRPEIMEREFLKSIR
jgi:tRNA(Leu) C34 or U34 (ribose-2'-O)-methylase TrmL